MDTLIAFYKIHYNFAALGVLFTMLALFLLLRGNIKWFLIIFIFTLSYNLGMKKLVDDNPAWFDAKMAQLSAFDFVDYIWGGSAVNSQNTSSEKRMNQ